MKHLIIGVVFLLVTSSCGVSRLTPSSPSHKLDFEQWKERLTEKIANESETLSDTLSPSIRIKFKYLIDDINREKSDTLLSRHEIALKRLGSIPPNASAYFAEYYLQGETSMLDYGMFWIKGNKFRGVWQDEKWKWHDMGTKPKFLKQFVKFKTDLDADELIYTGGGHILITEFKGHEIIDVNFVAVLSLSQFLVSNKVFQ